MSNSNQNKNKTINLISTFATAFSFMHAGAIQFLSEKLGVIRFLETVLEEVFNGDVEGVWSSRIICIISAILLFYIYTQLWRFKIIAHRLGDLERVERLQKVIVGMTIIDMTVIVISAKAEYASSSLSASQNGLGISGFFVIILWAVFNVGVIQLASYVTANLKVEEECGDSDSLLYKLFPRVEPTDIPPEPQKTNRRRKKLTSIASTTAKSLLFFAFLVPFLISSINSVAHAESMIRGKLSIVAVDSSVASGNFRNENNYIKAVRQVIDLILQSPFNIHYDRVLFLIFNDDVFTFPMMTLLELDSQKHLIISRFSKSYQKKQRTRRGLSKVVNSAMEVMCGGTKRSTYKYQHVFFISDMKEISTNDRNKLTLFDFKVLTEANILIYSLFVDRNLRSEYEKQGVRTLLSSAVLSNMPTAKELRRHRKTVKLNLCKRFIQKPVFF